MFWRSNCSELSISYKKRLMKYMRATPRLAFQQARDIPNDFESGNVPIHILVKLLALRAPESKRSGSKYATRTVAWLCSVPWSGSARQGALGRFYRSWVWNVSRQNFPTLVTFCTRGCCETTKFFSTRRTERDGISCLFPSVACFRGGWRKGSVRPGHNCSLNVQSHLSFWRTMWHAVDPAHHLLRMSRPVPNLTRRLWMRPEMAGYPGESHRTPRDIPGNGSFARQQVEYFYRNSCLYEIKTNTSGVFYGNFDSSGIYMCWQ